MANCADFVAAVAASSQTATLTPLIHNTLIPLAFSRNDCKTFLLTTTEFSVVDFAVNVMPTPSTGSFSFTVFFYRVTGKTLTALASVPAVEQYASFSKELTVGTYLVCFQTAVPVAFAGTVLATFRGYQIYAVISSFMSAGESVNGQFDNRRPPADCSAVLYYEMIDGGLPPGMRMTGLGQVRGVAPNLDCVEDGQIYPPAQNWSFQHNDGSYHPWGRQWRFKVRVHIEDMPDVNAEEWFCVKVHNNWSIDRDNFLAQAPFTISYEETVVTKVEIPVFCPTPVETVWEPQAIPRFCEADARPEYVVEKIETLCPTCSPDMQEVVDVIPIPFGLPSLNHLYVKAWLAAVRVEADKHYEYKMFLDRVERSPIFQQYLHDWPVEITEVSRNIVIRTYTDDPAHLFAKWRLEETRKLPWGIDFLGGEAMACELRTKERTV